jgi:hypothetical protein
MYTIGTSSLKFLRTKIQTTHPTAYADLDKRLLAYVGTATDKAATLIAAYSAFFQFTDNTRTQVQLYIPQNTTAPTEIWPLTPNAWVAVDTPFDQAFITEWLTPAGGLANGLYAFQRGNEADIGSAFAYPGLPYFAKDTRELWIYDGIAWQLAASGLFVGTMLLYPEHLAIPAKYAGKWIRCDGSVITQAQYPDLYALLASAPFGAAGKLPEQNNAIIKAVR